MELLQLEYFYAVAKTQHVTHTAEQLHIAQPALTQSIHRLERTRRATVSPQRQKYCPDRVWGLFTGCLKADSGKSA